MSGGRVRGGDAVGGLLTARLSGDEKQVRSLVFQAVPPDWFIPVGQLQYDTDPAIIESFVQLADMGILVQNTSRRIYPQGELRRTWWASWGRSTPRSWRSWQRWGTGRATG